MAGEKTVLENHRFREPSPPRQREPQVPSVNINSGGKGGTVVLITGTLFIGYLYFTRRLQNVFQAIRLPAAEWNINTAAIPNASPTDINRAGGLPPSTPPINPTVPGGKPLSIEVIIRYPPQYHLADEKIRVLTAACKSQVYQWVLYRTGSAATAKMISDQIYC